MALDTESCWAALKAANALYEGGELHTLLLLTAASGWFVAGLILLWIAVSQWGAFFRPKGG